MQVEMSLAELLINAISQGRVPGVQFKRGWSNDKATFDGLNEVIKDRLDGARRVAVQEALHKARDEQPVLKMRNELEKLRHVAEAANEYMVTDSDEARATLRKALHELAWRGTPHRALATPPKEGK